MLIGKLLYLFALAVLAVMSITETIRAGELEIENKRLSQELKALEKEKNERRGAD